MSLEKRRHRRFEMKKDAIATIYIGDVRDVGRIIDIGDGGIGVRYVASENPSIGGHVGRSCGIQIFASNGSAFESERLPAVIVYDIEVGQDSLTHQTVRRYGVKFGRLSKNRTEVLEYFIENYSLCNG